MTKTGRKSRRRKEEEDEAPRGSWPRVPLPHSVSLSSAVATIKMETQHRGRSKKEGGEGGDGGFLGTRRRRPRRRSLGRRPSRLKKTCKSVAKKISFRRGARKEG